MRWLLPFRPPILLPGLGWTVLTPSLLPRARSAVARGQGLIRAGGEEFSLADLAALKEAAQRLVQTRAQEQAREEPRPEPEEAREERESVLAELVRREAEFTRRAEEARRRAEREREVSSQPRPTRGYIPSPGS